MFKTKKQSRNAQMDARCSRTELNIVNLKIRVVELEEQVEDLQQKCCAMVELNKQMIDLIYSLVDEKLVKQEGDKK